MRVRELIAELQKKDPELVVAHPSRFNGRDDHPKVVEQVVTTTECSMSSEMVRCVILNPTFAQLDRSEEVRAEDERRVFDARRAEEGKIVEERLIAHHRGRRG
jgi:hypothetical protein